LGNGYLLYFRGAYSGHGAIDSLAELLLGKTSRIRISTSVLDCVLRKTCRRPYKDPEMSRKKVEAKDGAKPGEFDNIAR
jgi:hypothetical protein